jgi:hypothetical protein
MCKDTHFDKTNNNDIIKLTYNCCNKHKSEEQPGNEPKPLLGIITKNSSPPPKDLQNHLTNGHGAGDDLKQLKELQKSVYKVNE